MLSPTGGWSSLRINPFYSASKCTLHLPLLCKVPFFFCWCFLFIWLSTIRNTRKKLHSRWTVKTSFWPRRSLFDNTQYFAYTLHSLKKKKKYHSSIFYVSCSSSELSTWEGLWKEARHDLHNNRPYRPARAVVVDEQLWETMLSWGDLCGLWRTQHRDILANLDQSVLWPVKVKFKIKAERREERKEQNIPGLQRIRIQGQLKNMGGKPTFFSLIVSYFSSFASSLFKNKRNVINQWS